MRIYIDGVLMAANAYSTNAEYRARSGPIMLNCAPMDGENPDLNTLGSCSIKLIRLYQTNLTPL
jgi:hypothetical protein